MSKEVRSFGILKFSKVPKEFPDTLRPKHNSYYSEKILIMSLKYFSNCYNNNLEVKILICNVNFSKKRISK